MYTLYNLLLWGFSLAAFPLLLAKMIFSRRSRSIWREKIGFVAGEAFALLRGKPCIWIHAVSGGEVGAIHPLVRELRAAYPEGCLVLTTGTASGKKIIDERVAEATTSFFFPLDLPFIIAPQIRRVKPDLFIIAETELWPNFLRTVKRAGARTMLVNGRISERSFGRYRRTRFFWMAVLDYFDALSMIRVQDGERIVAMGANPVKVFVNGNCKFDGAALLADPSCREEMARLLEAKPEDLFLVAGSTHEGEEEILLEAFAALREKHPSLRLILAPRHIERVPRVEKILGKHGIRDFARRSQLKGGGKPAVVLWDTFGELFKVYSIASVVFCGASLVPKRGQNILEPAAWGKVVLYGPSMEDFLDARLLLESAGAGMAVGNGEELKERCLYLLDHPEERRSRGEAGREALLANRGATERNFLLARKLLEQSPDMSSHLQT